MLPSARTKTVCTFPSLGGKLVRRLQAAVEVHNGGMLATDAVTGKLAAPRCLQLVDSGSAVADDAVASTLERGEMTDKGGIPEATAKGLLAYTEHTTLELLVRIADGLGCRFPVSDTVSVAGCGRW